MEPQIKAAWIGVIGILGGVVLAHWLAPPQTTAPPSNPPPTHGDTHIGDNITVDNSSTTVEAPATTGSTSIVPKPSPTCNERNPSPDLSVELLESPDGSVVHGYLKNVGGATALILDQDVHLGDYSPQLEHASSEDKVTVRATNPMGQKVEPCGYRRVLSIDAETPELAERIVAEFAASYCYCKSIARPPSAEEIAGTTLQSYHFGERTQSPTICAGGRLCL